MRIKAVVGAVVVMAGLMASAAAQAGPAGDDLARCMSASTSQNDRVLLVRWMYAAVSVNPTLAPMSKVTPKQRGDGNTAAGALFTKLLTEDCKELAQKAVAEEGAAAIQESFQALGQIAAAEMFASPEVVQAISALNNTLDKSKLAVLRPQ